MNYIILIFLLVLISLNLSYQQDPPTTPPTTLPHESDIIENIGNLNMMTVIKVIQDLSVYPTRYYSRETGNFASNYFYNTFENIARCSDIVEVEKFSHTELNEDFTQSSIIGRILGDSDSTVIIGAHLDSANFFDDDEISNFVNDGTENSKWGTKVSYGADSGLSGAGIVVEIFRFLVDIGYKPDFTIEFILFAGSNKGSTDTGVYSFAGSSHIASSYKSSGKDIKVMFNLDSVGIPLNLNAYDDDSFFDFGDDEDEESCNFNPFGFTTDSILVLSGSGFDSEISDLYARCVTVFANVQYEPIQTDDLTAYESDHISFSNEGFPVGSVVESNIALTGLNTCGYEFQVHNTEKDVINNIDFNYLYQILRSTFGFVIETSLNDSTDLPSKIDPLLCKDIINYIYVDDDILTTVVITYDENASNPLIISNIFILFFLFFSVLI